MKTMIFLAHNITSSRQKFVNAKKHIMLISRTGFKKIIQIQIVEKN